MGLATESGRSTRPPDSPLTPVLSRSFSPRHAQPVRSLARSGFRREISERRRPWTCPSEGEGCSLHGRHRPLRDSTEPGPREGGLPWASPRHCPGLSAASPGQGLHLVGLLCPLLRAEPGTQTRHTLGASLTLALPCPAHVQPDNRTCGSGACCLRGPRTPQLPAVCNACHVPGPARPRAHGRPVKRPVVRAGSLLSGTWTHPGTRTQG